MSAKKDAKWISLFFDIIERAFLGGDFTFGKEVFKLQPTLVRPVDFQRRISGSPSSSYEALIKALNVDFKTLARSEVYRVRKGWVEQGLKGYCGRKIRRIKPNRDIFLIPDLSQRPSVGIDTSGLGDSETVIVICSIPDSEGAYYFLEKHLNLPKDHKKRELHWSRLNKAYRDAILEKFKFILSVCCDGLLVIRTSALIDRRDKIQNLFRNLVEGCFSGYERDPRQKGLRPALKKGFLDKTNGIPIHCDTDFHPLAPEDIVRLLVQTLARKDGGYEPYTPLYANLRSHESKSIQVSDIMVGMIRTRMNDAECLDPLQLLPFDMRKMRKYAGSPPKAYYWFP